MKRKKKHLFGSEELAWWVFIFVAAAFFVYVVFGQPIMAEAEGEFVEKPREVHIYDVPLDGALQEYINGAATYYDIDAALVFAIIGVESNFDVDAIGDDGESVGLMQIQQKHHQKRMDKLGSNDLSHPYHNVMVGCDYLAELLGRSDDMNWVLTAYNGGIDYANQCKELGVQTEYAEKVLVYKEILENEKN